MRIFIILDPQLKEMYNILEVISIYVYIYS